MIILNLQYMCAQTSNIQNVIVNCSGASFAAGRSDLRDAWYNFKFFLADYIGRQGDRTFEAHFLN